MGLEVIHEGLSIKQSTETLLYTCLHLITVNVRVIRLLRPFLLLEWLMPLRNNGLWFLGGYHQLTFPGEHREKKCNSNMYKLPKWSLQLFQVYTCELWTLFLCVWTFIYIVKNILSAIVVVIYITVHTGTCLIVFGILIKYPIYTSRHHWKFSIEVWYSLWHIVIGLNANQIVYHRYESLLMMGNYFVHECEVCIHCVVNNYGPSKQTHTKHGLHTFQTYCIY